MVLSRLLVEGGTETESKGKVGGRDRKQGLVATQVSHKHAKYFPPMEAVN